MIFTCRGRGGGSAPCGFPLATLSGFLPNPDRNVTARRKTNFLCDFSGGAADKNGTLRVGDEILSVNSVDVTRMTRLEAWNFMKKLNDGSQVVTVRQKLQQQQQQQQQVVTVVVTGSSSSSVPLVKTELVADATTTSCRAEKTH
jgi:hypothetical protein